MDLSVSEMSIDGQKMFGLVHDVTERKAAEDSLRQAKEALETRVQERTAELTTCRQRGFAGGQGSGRGGQPGQERVFGQYEPRNPHADERHHRHDRTGAGHPALPRSSAIPRSRSRSAEALLAIINDILDFSKIEAGKLRSRRRRRSTSARAPGRHVRRWPCGRTAKGLELACHIHPDVPDGLVGDPAACAKCAQPGRQCLKFTEQGEIVVDVGPREPADRRGRCCTSTWPTPGIGIPADKQTAIFEAFEQADGTDDAPFGGTGLGLAISTRLVELMGGRIWVESEPGRGSTFHFTRPLAAWPTASRCRRADEPAACTACRCWWSTTTPPTAGSSRKCSAAGAAADGRGGRRRGPAAVRQARATGSPFAWC